MSTLKSNSEQLHEAGVINKNELSIENIASINSLSEEEEVGHLKAVKLSTKKVNKTAGFML